MRQNLSDNLLPIGHLVETGVLADRRARWWGAFMGDRLCALTLCVGRTDEGWAAATPAGDPDGTLAIGEALRGVRFELILAPREAADALWIGLGRPAPRVWSDHLLAVCERVSPGPRLDLRRARLDELDAVVHMAAELEREDLGVDPRLEEPELHREQVAARVQAGCVWLGEREGRVVFKGDVGLHCPHGALIGSLWVDPGVRGQGLGAAGTRALCDRLLAQTPRVGLHVGEGNRPARAAYRKAGFEERAPFRLFLAR